MVALEAQCVTFAIAECITVDWYLTVFAIIAAVGDVIVEVAVTIAAGVIAYVTDRVTFAIAVRCAVLRFGTVDAGRTAMIDVGVAVAAAVGADMGVVGANLYAHVVDARSRSTRRCGADFAVRAAMLDIGIGETGRVVTRTEVIAAVAGVLTFSADALGIAILGGVAGRAVFTAMGDVIIAVTQSVTADMIIDGAVDDTDAVEAVTYRAFRRGACSA